MVVWSTSARSIAKSAGRLVGKGAVGLWDLVLRNRIAIGLASLVWLLVRSGSQPRRLAYPCQQAAAANVGSWMALLAPSVLLRGHGDGSWHRGSFARRALVVGRTLFAATAVFLVMLVGARAYEYATTETAYVPNEPATMDTPTPATVAIVKDPALPTDNAEINAMVREAVAKAGGLAGIVTPGCTVVIKPNLVVSGVTGTSGVVTNPQVVLAVVQLAKEAGAGTVKIAEGTASDMQNYQWGRTVTWKAYKDAGYWNGADPRNPDLYPKVFSLDTSVELVDLNDTGGLDTYDPNKVSLITIPNGVLRTQYWVPKVLLRPDQGGTTDVLITVPVFKNHGNAAMTLALKNRVGCAPSDIYYHPSLPPNMKWGVVHTVSKFPRNVSGDVPPPTTDENPLVNYSIVDLNLVRPQEFCVADALVGITNGPVGDGGVVNRLSPYMGCIMAARDSVAIDTVAGLCMNYDPTQMAQIWWSAHRGLGTMDTTWITVLGKRVASVRRSFPARGGSVPCNLVSPQMSDISLVNNAAVWGTVPVVGSGVSDDKGVTKAELYVDGELVAVNRTAPFASFAWDSTTVADGTRSVELVVYDAALNEKAITRNVRVANASLAARVDFDADGDIDLADFASFNNCFNGPNQPPTFYCAVNADFDKDGDVDLSDFAQFQTCFNGPNRPAGCS